MESLAVRLKATRKKRGMSQQELAKAAGVAQGTISAIEVGKITEPMSIFKIAPVLSVKPSWLMYGEGQPGGEIDIPSLKEIISLSMKCILESQNELSPDRLASLVVDVNNMGRKNLKGKPWTPESMALAVNACLENQTARKGSD